MGVTAEKFDETDNFSAVKIGEARLILLYSPLALEIIMIFLIFALEMVRFLAVFCFGNKKCCIFAAGFKVSSTSDRGKDGG